MLRHSTATFSGMIIKRGLQLQSFSHYSERTCSSMDSQSLKRTISPLNDVSQRYFEVSVNAGVLLKSCWHCTKDHTLPWPCVHKKGRFHAAACSHNQRLLLPAPEKEFSGIADSPRVIRLPICHDLLNHEFFPQGRPFDLDLLNDKGIAKLEEIGRNWRKCNTWRSSTGFTFGTCQHF